MPPALQLRQAARRGRHRAGAWRYDALSARLVQRAGFEAIYMTGFGATASRLGQPDIGLLTQTEMTTHARDMVRAVGIPVIADADTGYGGRRTSSARCASTSRPAWPRSTSKTRSRQSAAARWPEFA
jgi:2-methylisocitrate lyase-like PEP mutase family enzyme